MFMLVTSVAVVLFGIAISWLFKAIEWNDKRGEKND